MPTRLRPALTALFGVAAILVPLAGSAGPVLGVEAPKVVIIVGPAGAATASYRADAEAAAAEARKYTPNVVTLYSPNATWDVVAPALQGASIVIDMGHGNGFPSPYTFTLQPDRQDGLGLNPAAGVDDSATQYWGEQYLASGITLAPNAVVILGHLCYASGSSEPGSPDPTLDVARQRADNFAAGYLAAGARAVIAEAYDGSAAAYVDALFTSHTSVGEIWAAAPSRQNNAVSFASVRTPGMTGELDPDQGSGRYYRSIVGELSLASDAIITGAVANTSNAGSLASPSASPSPSPTVSPTPTPTPSPPAVVATTPPSPSAGPPGSLVGTVRWTTTAVRLRTMPTTSGKTLVILPPGTAVRVRATAADGSGQVWFRAWTKSGTGWLASWLTSATRAPAPALAAPSASPAADRGWQTAQATSFGVGDGLVGQPMACGGTLTDTVMAVAHRTLPCGTHVRLRYGTQVVDAQVLDRGPYVDGVTLDLAPAVCHSLGSCATITVEWQVLP